MDDDKARRMVEKLTHNNLLSGWGVRTLAGNEPAFDPLSYHVGTVWPHDGAIVGLGVMRYGYAEAAREIAKQHLEAIQTFPDLHVQELYSGFQRDPQDKEILDYPFRCNPQAWSAASAFAFLDILRKTPSVASHGNPAFQAPTN